MPRSWKAHTKILKAALRLFSSTEMVKNSSWKKPLESKYLLFINYWFVLARREIFTADDSMRLIQKICLNSRYMTRAIRKRKGLQKYPVPSRTTNWKYGHSFAKAAQALRPHLPNKILPGVELSGAREDITPLTSTSTTISLPKKMVGMISAILVLDTTTPTYNISTNVSTATVKVATPTTTASTRVMERVLTTVEPRWVSKATQKSNNDPTILPEKPGNYLVALKLSILESFEDEDFTPVAMDSTVRTFKTFYKSRRGLKTKTAQLSHAMQNPLKRLATPLKSCNSLPQREASF